MKIGQKPVHSFKGVAGINIQARFARPWRNMAVFVRHALQRPGGGCAHGDHPFGGVDFLRGLRADFKKFRLHDMVFHLLGFNRHKRPRTDMQRHGRYLNASGEQIIQNIR